jgi:YVTN family beta-propeller protein
LVGAVAAIVVAAIVVAAIAVGGGSSTRAGAGITVGNSPDGIAIGQGSVWIANAGDATVTRIDEKSAKVLATLSYANRSEPAAAITVFGSTLWIADSNAGVVKRFDAINGNPFGTPINVGGRPDGITFASGDIWVTSYDNNTVTRIDGGSQAPVGRPIPVGRGPRRIGGGLNSVWTANSGEGTVTRIDASTGKVIATIAVGGHPVATSIANRDLWVVNYTNNSVARFDALSGMPIGSPIPVGTAPKRITAGKDSLWVTNSGDGTVSRISATTGQVLATIAVGGHPDVITVRRGVVWVATWSQATMHYRGAPGTIVRINESTGKRLGA